ncbi:MAG: hypothetical protein ABSH38_22135, partial [Verrucomicrobiota bacterium]
YRIKRDHRYVKRFNQLLLATFSGRCFDLQALTQNQKELRLRMTGQSLFESRQFAEAMPLLKFVAVAFPYHESTS